MSDKIIALFEGQELSDELKGKVETIFEAVVTEKVNAQVAIVKEETEAEINTLKEGQEQAIAEGVEAQTKDLSEQVDKFLNYVCESWAKENAVALEAGVKVSIAESLMEGMKGMLAEHNIELSTEDHQVVEGLEAEKVAMQAKLDESLQKEINLNVEIGGLKKDAVLVDVCEELTDSQLEKMQELAEGIDYVDEAAYTAKVKTLKESYFPSDAVVEQVNEEVDGGKGEPAKALPNYISEAVKLLNR